MTDLSDLEGKEHRRDHPLEGWFEFAQAYREAVDRAADGALFVEVGCWKGRSSVALGRLVRASGKNIRVHCVDTWRGSWSHRNHPGLPNIYRRWLENTGPFRDFMVPHMLESVEAARNYDFVDFVWLDAAHDYRSVTADLRAWAPKAAVIGGDDLWMPSVRRAVAEYFTEFEDHGTWWRHG